MKTITSIENIHQSGKFGDYQSKNEEKLIKVSEVKNLLIVQIVHYKIFQKILFLLFQYITFKNNN